MSLLGNILWIVFGGGLAIFLEYLVGAGVLCLTIVGIPFGVQCAKLAVLGLVPFGKEIDAGPQASGCLLTLMNIVWLLVFGIWIALTHAFFALLCAITIIGIPFAYQHMKLAAFALAPFGKGFK